MALFPFQYLLFGSIINYFDLVIVDLLFFFFFCRKCPQTLVAPIIKLALDQTNQTLRKTPEQFGYLANTNGKFQLDSVKGNLYRDAKKRLIST